MVSPLPPLRTGIADYTIDVARALVKDHAVDLFHDQDEVAGALGAPPYRIENLPKRHAADPYDAVVYQMGNAPAHDFMYEWLERFPGAVVLHDLVLHHSFARRFLESPESLAYAADPSNDANRKAAGNQHDRYVEEIERTHRGLGQRLKDAHFNTAGDLLPFAFPLFEPALRHATAVAAHNPFMVEAIRDARPALPCFEVAMPAAPIPVPADTVEALRQSFGLSAAHKVVGCFGLMTREKRVETVARAVARIAALHPDIRLLLAGPVSDAAWLLGVLQRSGIKERVMVTGRLSAFEFAAAMALADVVVHLRYPTARETSAALLRVMAQGRPAIISDIANQGEIPDDAVARVDASDEEGDLARAIDALLRNPGPARAMGERGRQFILAHHSEVRTRETYARLLGSQAPGPSPAPL